MARIHPTAVVDPRAKLADGAVVGPGCVVGPDVELGPGVVLDSHVHVQGRTTLGARTRVSPHCALGGDPQVVGATGDATQLVIGSDNVIREFVSIHVGSPGGGGCTRIGSHNYLMNHVHVGHDGQVGSHCILGSYSGLGGHVEIQDWVFLGGMTGVHQHARVGESAFTAAGAMLSRDVPPFARVAGDRARFAGVNTVGLRRRGLSDAAIAALKHAFHVLFHAKLRLAPAVERVRDELGHVPEVERLLRFLLASERGLAR